MLPSFPDTETTFLLPGPAGDLELLTAMPVVTPKNAVAIICHPHPLFSGTMRNKVVTTLAKTFHELGLSTVRFNFRGVGKSAGSFADGVGETDDLFAIIKWVQTVRPDASIWLAGFSFGAAVAIYAATQFSAAQLVSIAPPVIRFPLIKNAIVNCPWVLVQGEDDEVVLAEDVFAWIQTLVQQPDIIRMQQVGHFFHGKLGELQKVLTHHLEAN